MSEDKPFTFTDKRKVHESVAADASGDQDAAGAAAGPESAQRGQSAQPEVDELAAEAGALYEDAVRDADALKARVSELEEQLKREQAEYVNSRRRIEASAQASRHEAAARVLVSLLPVLDDIELARQHGDLDEGTPFASIATKVEEILATHGVQRFGAVGEEFDPARHEALMHEQSEDADLTTLTVVMQPGYMIADRVARPARVGTVGPA